MNGDLHIGIFQIDSLWLSPNENIEKLKTVLSTIPELPQLIVLPEMWTTGFVMQPEGKVHAMSDSHMATLSSLAREYNVDILGSFAVEEKAAYYNRAILISKNGDDKVYDKQYLFSPSGEQETYTAGLYCNTIDYEYWKLKLQICYDLRFPESVRSAEEVDLIIYMANWPTPRVYHWKQLLIARAIENQCQVIGCNRVGKDDNGWEFPGNSLAVDHMGYVITEMGDKEAYQKVTLSKATMTDYRAKLPFYKDKKI